MFVTSAFGWVILVSLTISTADAIGCYTCTNVSSVSQCRQTTTCGSPGERCRLEYTTALNGKIFTLGCSDATHCPKSSPPGLIGRSTARDSCTECCITDNCNRQLCQEHNPSCTDTAGFDCATIGATINYCDEPHRAKTYCQHFCGLCSMRDGGWSLWTPWSDCTVSCGNGTQSRVRACTNPLPTDGGDNCVGTANAVQTCSQRPCRVHGSWSSWSSWDSCSSTCDIGVKQRERSCNNPFPSADGNFCVGSFRDNQICVMQGCLDGGWSAWSTWNACSRSCGDGVNSRSRACDNPTPSITGRNCAGDFSQTQLCHVRNCQDGGWSAWSSWSVCSRSCGDGINSRSRICDNPTPSTSARYCVGDHSHTQSCKVKTCPDGVWSAWSSWSVCSRTCGDGINSRSRTCGISGRYCVGDPSQTQSCKVKTCPVKVSAFTVSYPTGDGNPLKFTWVVFNEGGNFNTATGKFTCTIPGVYFFALSVVKVRSSDDSINNGVNARIRHNGSSKVYTETNPDDQYADNGSYGATATVTFRLSKGDIVDVESTHSKTIRENSSMFSGFLIQPDES